MNRTISSLLCPLACVFLFLSIASPSADAALGDIAVYHKPIPSLSISLDPQSVEDSYSYHIVSQIYDTLFELDEFLSIRPKLASGWKVSENGLEYQITLKPDIRFHNNKQLTADDLIFTLHRFVRKFPHKYPELLLISGADDFLSGKSSSIRGIHKISNLSVGILLSSPSPTFMMVLTTPHLSILPYELLGQPDNVFFQRPIGTGPFKVENYTKNKQVRLAGNPDYFAGRPYLTELFYEQATRQQAIDGFNSNYFQDLQWYNPSPNELKTDYSVIRFPISRVDLLFFNTRRKPFSDKNARMAVKKAIDKQRLISECFSDKIMAKGLIPHGIGGYDKDFKESSATPDLTKLPKGEAGTKISILRMENYPCHSGFDRIVGDSLKKIRFDPQISYVTFQDFIDNYQSKNNFDMVELQFFSDYPEAAPLLNYFQSGQPMNLSGFESKKYDGLLQNAGTAIDKLSRYGIYHQLQNILEDEAVIVPIYYDIESIVHHQNIKGIKRPSLISASLAMGSIYFER